MSQPDGNGPSEDGVAPTDVEHGELVELDPSAVEVVDIDATESVTEPGKVMRIGSMVKQLLEEVRQAPLDEASRERLAEIYERSIVEVSGALSPDLQEELHSLALPFRPDVVPSEA
ncbi:MAG TPA: proteasome activator, partial [Ilumatobacteraceae bacterium]|nr:proteasome activator [Ilumatobacteraceae bacterium]